jgi:hypothetical protein
VTIGPLTDADRQALVELLAPDAQRDRLIADVARILAEPLRTPAQIAALHIERAESCRLHAESLRTSPDMSLTGAPAPALLQQLEDQERHDRRLAEVYRTTLAKYSPKFARQIMLLLIWDGAGFDFYINRARKRSGKERWPKPTGRVISYLMIVAKVEAHTARDVVKKFCNLRLFAIGTPPLPGEGSLVADATLVSATKPPVE